MQAFTTHAYKKTAILSTSFFHHFFAEAGFETSSSGVAAILDNTKQDQSLLPHRMLIPMILPDSSPAPARYFSSACQSIRRYR